MLLLAPGLPEREPRRDGISTRDPHRQWSALAVARGPSAEGIRVESAYDPEGAVLCGGYDLNDHIETAPATRATLGALAKYALGTPPPLLPPPPVLR